MFVFRAISWACSMGSRECQAQAGALFSRWMEADSPDTSQDNPWVLHPYIMMGASSAIIILSNSSELKFCTDSKIADLSCAKTFWNIFYIKNILINYMSVCSRNLVLHHWLDIFFRIDVNLKYETYCNAISDGGEEEWDFGWSRYMVQAVFRSSD